MCVTANVRFETVEVLFAFWFFEILNKKKNCPKKLNLADEIVQRKMSVFDDRVQAIKTLQKQNFLLLRRTEISSISSPNCLCRFDLFRLISKFFVAGNFHVWITRHLRSNQTKFLRLSNMLWSLQLRRTAQKHKLFRTHSTMKRRTRLVVPICRWTVSLLLLLCVNWPISCEVSSSSSLCCGLYSIDKSINYFLLLLSSAEWNFNILVRFLSIFVFVFRLIFAPTANRSHTVDLDSFRRK